MFILLHIPIFDFRYFINQSAKLTKPLFPASIYQHGMIRKFGEMNFRPLGGSINFAGEGIFCSANRAIKFVNFEKTSPLFINHKYIFRRFYHDGKCLSKLQIGFLCSFYENQLLDVINYHDNLDVIIGLNEKSIKLKNSGKALANLYHNSSSQHKKYNIDDTVENNAVIKGSRIYILKVSQTEAANLKFPKNIKYIRGCYFADLYYYHDKRNDCRAWIIVSESATTFKEDLRQLRIALLNITSEKELLIKASKYIIDTDPSLLNEDVVKRFFIEKTKMLSKSKRFNIEQQKILSYAYSLYDDINEINSNDIKHYFDIVDTKYPFLNLVEKFINYNDIEKRVVERQYELEINSQQRDILEKILEYIQKKDRISLSSILSKCGENILTDVLGSSLLTMIKTIL